MGSDSLVRLGHEPNTGGGSVGQAGAAQPTQDLWVLSEDQNSPAHLLTGYGTQPLLGRPGSVRVPRMPHHQYYTI